MHQLNILLADDTPSVGLFVSEYLRDAGHSVTYVRSGEEAVEAYRRQSFDLVLMDVVMPGMGGLEAVKQIKAIPKSTWVPVLIVTGQADEESILSGFLAGADDYILKPLKPVTLDIRIRSMMRISGIQQSTVAVIDSMIEGVIQIDRAGRVCRFNKAAERIFGYSEPEVLGKNVNMLMPSPYKEGHDDYLSNYMATGEPKVIGIGRRVSGLRKNGETFPMQLGVSEAHTTDGSYFIGLVHDLSVEERLIAQVAESERFMKLLVDVLPGMMGYWTNELRCSFANQSYLDWFGKKPEEMQGIRMQDMMGEALFKKNEPFIRAALRGETQHFERTLVKADGSTRHTWAHYIPDIEGGRVCGFFVLVSDITELKTAEQALRESRRFLSDLIENSGTLIFAKDREGRYRLVNRKFEESTGMGRESVLGQTDTTLYPEAIAAQFRQNDLVVMESGRVIESEETLQDSTGLHSFLTVKFPLRDEAGEINGVCGMATDITERKLIQQEVERLAQTDVLTNLPNRRHLMSLAELEVSRTLRYSGELSVLMMDIDHFKSINDTHGHEAGDAVLSKIGTLCREALREVDVVGRIGGEEFAILLPQTDHDQAIVVAERLRQTIADAVTVLHDGALLQFTVSIGGAVFVGDASINLERLLSQADKCLYEAKRSGRNRVCVKPPSPNEKRNP